MTADHFLLIYDNPKQDYYKKADFKFACNSVSMVQKEPLLFELIGTKPGFIFNSKKSLLLKFSKLDEFEELKCMIETIGIE